MNPIGGYFELELRQGEHYHKDALRLDTARNCFEYVLRARKYKKVYIPYYTCEVMLEPLKKCKVEYDFYHINKELEPVDDFKLKDGEVLLYTNYYGLKQNYVERLASQYGSRLIVDNAQAFYAKPIDGIDTFYSARKFFGVADGAYLYTDCKLDEQFEQDHSYDRMSHLLKRADIGAEFGYPDFRTNDDSLINNPIRRMSNLTEKILCSIDYDDCRKKRIENFKYLEEYLKSCNRIHFELNEDDVPMVYPYLTDDESLRSKLIENKIFVAKYWPNVFEWTKPGMLENEFAKNLLAIPCDQRYEEVEMNRIIELICK